MKSSHFRKSINIFNSAVNNEIAIDKYVIDKLNKLNNKKVSYIPIRPMKSLHKIQSLKIGKQTYLFLSFLFLLVCPFFFTLQLFKIIIYTMRNSSSIAVEKKIMLNSGANTFHLSQKTNEKDLQHLIIKPSKNKKHFNISSTFKVKHFVLAYLYSIIATVFIAITIKDKRNIAQCYIALEFFLVMFALKDIKKFIDTIYYCNHFDRWAVLIDNIFFDKELILIQHGVLPESISLDYKSINVSRVFTFNKTNKERFIKYVLARKSKTTFTEMDVSLELQPVNHNKKTILLIGQPHSIKNEIEIIKRIKDNYIVYVKPHPGFSSTPYEKIINIILIEQRHYYPKVDLVLNYESTLGIEYEASNIKVIWWKDINIDELTSIINQSLKHR